MDNEFENIVPWNGAKDTGCDVRLKWQRNFERIKANFEELQKMLEEFDVENLYKCFLRKDQEDSTNFLIKFLGGLISDNIESQNFTSGPLGTGFVIKRDSKTGRSYIETDELYVRLKAYFDTLELKHLKHVGGTLIATPAGMDCIRVEVVSGDNGSVYRCYFKQSDGDKEVYNEFDIDDLAQCREFNVKTGTSEQVSNQYYWRRVVGLGDNYIDLSMTDCDSISGAPMAGDTIVTIGNKTNQARQNAIIIYAYGEGSPAFMQYKGINDYSLEGKAKTIISPERNEFRGTFFFDSGDNIKDYIDVSGEAIKSEVTSTILQIIPGEITLEVQKQISTVVDDIEELQTNVSNLTVNYNQISSSVVSIQSTAEDALSTANSAQSTANAANTAANNASLAAAAAEEIAEKASEIGMYGQESYNQTTNPWNSWSSGTEYKHVGALWYNPNTDTTQVYVGTSGSNSWETISTSKYAVASYVLQNSDKISAVVANFDSNGNPTSASGIITEAYGNTLWASSALEDGNELVSIINQSSTTIKLSAQRINLNGTVTANGTFSISTAGNITCTGGTIGGFTITSTSLSCDGLESSFTIGVDGGRFFRVNYPSGNSMVRVRADGETCMELTAFGTNNSCVGLSVLCNGSGYGYAIKSTGNALLDTRSGERVTIKGLTVNYRTVSSSTTLATNDDYIRFTNTSAITVTMPPAVAGKVIYMSSMQNVTLRRGSAIGFRTQDYTIVSSYRNTNNRPRMWIYDGSYWNEFYCGN